MKIEDVHGGWGTRRCALFGSWMLALTAAFGGAVISAAPSEEMDPFCQLGPLFKAYCDEHERRPAACRDGALPSLQWLHLNDYCDSSGADQAVCGHFGEIQEVTRPSLLVYDHVLEAWFSGGGIPLRKGRLEKDVTGAPLVHLPRQHDLVVLVANTNPLLYRATITESTEEDIDQLSNLGTLVGLLGGVMGAFTAEVRTLVNDTPIRDASEQLQALADSVAEVEVLIQEVELSTTAVASTCDFSSPSWSAVVAIGTDLRATRNRLVEEPNDAGEAFAAYLAILDADPEKWATVENAKQALVATIETSPNATQLRELSVVSNGGARTLLESANAITNARTHDNEQEEFRLDAERKRRTYQNIYAMRKRIETLLEKWPTAVKSASQIEVFTERCRQALVGDAIAHWMVLDREDLPIKWSKRQKHKIKVAVDSPYADNIAKSRPAEVKTAYRLEWNKTRLFDVGFALTYTPLESPTFSSVSAEDPENSDAKVIGQTGEESRSSELALFLNYQFVQHAWPSTRSWTVRPSLDLGAGLDLGTPAVYAGLSVGIGKYLRVGGGWTWQHVNALDGQMVGDPVTSNDDIRTTNVFDDDYYASVMLQLGSLPFFKPKE